jgi:hypothetical protein
VRFGGATTGVAGGGALSFDGDLFRDRALLFGVGARFVGGSVGVVGGLVPGSVVVVNGGGLPAVVRASATLEI